jgi:hypothetical protein
MSMNVDATHLIVILCTLFNPMLFYSDFIWHAAIFPG